MIQIAIKKNQRGKEGGVGGERVGNKAVGGVDERRTGEQRQQKLRPKARKKEKRRVKRLTSSFFGDLRNDHQKILGKVT